MQDNDIKRVSRLIAILTQLQTKKLITATGLAEKFQVSTRTIYRDIKTLEQSGVPVYTEEGKGFSLMEGYRIPPVMFTERQANALIIAEQLVLKSRDNSLIHDYSEAIEKIKAVLRHSDKTRVNLLSERTKFDAIINYQINSNWLSILQTAITNFYLTQIDYTNAENISSARSIEPFALLNTTESWLLIAYCHSRKGFRYFRLDRIKNITVTTEKFEPHKMTLQDFFEKYHKP